MTVGTAIFRALSVLLCAGLALAAEPSGGPERTEDLRIVSLTPSVTEAVFALGAGGALVAVSDYCDYPPAAASLPRVGTFLTPVVERVLSLQPDLVITSPSPGNRNAVEAIERAGVRVGVVSEGSGSLEEAYTALIETARLIGREAGGQALVADMRAQLARIQARVAGLPRPRTAMVVDFDPLVLAGSSSYLGALIAAAGGENIARPSTAKWPRAGWEFLIVAAPEVVIDLSQEARVGNGLERWQRFSEIPAVRNGRVHAGEGHLLLRPGPRLPLAAESIARVLHPEAWKR